MHSAVASYSSHPQSQKEAYDSMIFRREMRRSVRHFITRAFSHVDPGAVYKPNWHVDLIGEYLQACSEGEITRLIINVPPRFLKSICVSIAWPAWLLGRNPSEQILSTSYSASLALKHSRDCRSVMQSSWYRQLFPEVELAKDYNLKSEFLTTRGGHRAATSVGGTATGKGGNVLIVDDPLNPEQALSDAERNTSNDWFDQTFSTRLNDMKKGVMVVIMQRLHQDDLTGHLKGQGGWEHLVLENEATKKTIVDFRGVQVTREPGDLLHPERLGIPETVEKKRVLGSYGYAGQYQQTPAPLGGGLMNVSWFNRYDTAPKEFIRIIQSWDTAAKEKDINDPSVCTTWGETDRGYYLLHVLQERLNYPSLKRTVISHAQKWKPDGMLIEDKSSGEALIADLKYDTKFKTPIIAIMPCNDKIVRASACSPTIEGGLCWLPNAAPWLVDYESELRNFPNSSTKDQVDSTSQFLNWAKKPVATPRIRSL